MFGHHIRFLPYEVPLAEIYCLCLVYITETPLTTTCRKVYWILRLVSTLVPDQAAFCHDQVATLASNARLIDQKPQ
ncbi:hypothetical protein [Nocardia sp. NPDC049707]|uniref:hypothetical protein n=1 Tax=Nocardia sp. NPDC049707 TaxID=3154735 RepID=UPI00343A80D9